MMFEVILWCPEVLRSQFETLAKNGENQWPCGLWGDVPGVVTWRNSENYQCPVNTMLWIAQEVKEIKKIKEIIKIQSGIIVILESDLASDLIFLGNQWSNQDYQSHLDRPVGLIWKSGVQMWSCPLIVWFGSPWRSRFWSGHFFKDIFVIQHHWSLRSLWLKEYQSHLGPKARINVSSSSSLSGLVSLEVGILKLEPSGLCRTSPKSWIMVVIFIMLVNLFVFDWVPGSCSAFVLTWLQNGEICWRLVIILVFAENSDFEWQLVSPIRIWHWNLLGIPAA